MNGVAVIGLLNSLDSGSSAELAIDVRKFLLMVRTKNRERKPRFYCVVRLVFWSIQECQAKVSFNNHLLSLL